jgi:hypothetical protein
MGECPSGQRELTVNQPATPTVVRIRPRPHNCPGLPGQLIAHVAQQVEHILGKNEVIGSNPIVGSHTNSIYSINEIVGWQENPLKQGEFTKWPRQYLNEQSHM